MSGTEATLGVGDYIVRGDARGQIVGGNAKDGFSVAMFDKEGKLGAPESGVAATDLKNAGYRAYMSSSGLGPAYEVAINSVVYAVISKMRKSTTTFGPRFMSFMISDAIYEFGGKYFLEQYVPMLRPESLAKADATGWFSQGDFRDGLKAIPIILIQEIVQKFMYRQKAFVHAMKNAVDAYASIVAGNISGRVITASTKALPGANDQAPVYRW